MKKTVIGLFTLVFLLSFGTAVFAGGSTEQSGTSAKQVTFTYVNYIGKKDDQVGATVDTYMKEHPNVKIEYQLMDHSTLQEKLRLMIESDTLPDMFWWNGALLVQTLETTKSLLDLTPYFNSTFKSRFLPGAFTMLSTKDGRIAGFPAEMQVQAWMFNKALFDKYGLKIPTTFAELKAVVPVFKEHGINTIAFGTKDNWPTWGFEQWFQLWGINEQAHDLFATHSLKVADSAVAKVFERLAELQVLGAFPANNSTINFEQMVTMFLSGKAAMISLPSDQLGKIIGQPVAKDVVFNWGIHFPKSPYPQNIAIKMVGNGYGIGANVAKDPAKLKAIINFNKWRYSDAAYPLALKAGFILPVRAKYDPSTLGPIMRQQARLIGDDMKPTITAAYASLQLWGMNTDIWLPDFNNIENNIQLSLINGSMTAADLPAQYKKLDHGIDVAIKAYNASK